MIAITGANGHLGKATIKCLLQKMDGKNIIAMVRDPSKLKEFLKDGIDIRTADYEDPESLNEALKGVGTLLQISTTSMGERGIQQELNVVDAAKKQGVQHLVYTSGLKPREEAHFFAVQQCLKTENAILSSGICYTILRNGLYLETIPLFIGNALEDGNIYLSAGEGKVSFVGRDDIAEALSIVLTETVHKNKIYEITGAEAFNFEELARLLSKQTGRQIGYVDIPDEALKDELLKAGVPDEEAEWFLSLTQSIRHHEFADIEPALESLIRRKPVSVSDYLKVFNDPVG